ncbi:MAG: hypothetical protein FVQ82_08305 [Planctomycetes bacterium]|nr:hypothetical protein [Planctomycetota bacterium]
MESFANLPLREPLKNHFGGQANLFDCGRRQEKSTLATAKADFPSLPECNPDVHRDYLPLKSNY